MSSYRSTFSEFAQKYGKESRFKSIDKMREREGLFNEYMLQVRKHAKEAASTRADKVGHTRASCQGGGGRMWVYCLGEGVGLLIGRE